MLLVSSGSANTLFANKTNASNILTSINANAVFPEILLAFQFFV